MYTFSVLIKVMISLALAVILGNGSVVAFNHFPVRWFEDENEDGGRDLPDALLQSIESGRQRLPSTPWKIGFTAFFCISGVFLSAREPVQFVVAALIVMAIVLEMAISDALYTRVPDQLQILLAVSALGFIGFFDYWWEPLAGAVLGLILSLAVYGLGRMIYHRTTIGGADIKFYIGIGLVTGRSGVIIVFVLTSVLTALQALINGIRTRDTVGSTMKQSLPMMPCAFVAVAVYLLFLWSVLDVIVL
ncbi:MAG: A24 family peptidase [Firmicutes bacterium]|nr:A24 family peptidase [Bacillota bacterium]